MLPKLMLLTPLIAFSLHACSTRENGQKDAPTQSSGGTATKISTLWAHHRLLTKGELPFEFCIEFGQLPGDCQVYKLSSGKAWRPAYDAKCHIEVHDTPSGIAVFGAGVEPDYDEEEPLSSFLTDSPVRGDELTISETSKDPLYGSPVTWTVTEASCQEFLKQ